MTELARERAADLRREGDYHAVHGNNAAAADARTRAAAETDNARTGGQTGNNEVTGVVSLVSYLESVAARHAQIGAGEAFLGSLRRMEVGADDRQLVADAQEASQNAAALWKSAAEQVAAHNLPLREQYSLNPSAGNKDANTNE